MTENKLAIHAHLNYPAGVFVSPANNEIYIAELLNHRIRKVLQNGNIVTIAGNGNQGFSGDGDLATNAQVSCPHSVSSHNQVYFGDFRNNRVRKILENGRIAGNGTKGYGGDDDIAINARNIFVSSNNEVYIADLVNHRIRKILENGIITTIAGNGHPGFSGDGGLAIDAQLKYPNFVFVTASNEVYISEYGNN